MIIGIDIRTLMDARYSGVPEYTLNLTKEILKLDKKNQYKLFYNSGRNIAARMPEFPFPNARVVATRYPNKIFNNIMQRLLKTPKIDEALGVDLFFMPNIGFISLSSNCKKIITVHDLSFLRYSEFYSLKRRLWHKIINIKRFLKQFDAIAAVSKSTKQDIIELIGIDEKKIKVIYSGISPAFRLLEGEKEARETKQKYALPKKFILALSTLEPRKNIEGIIEAFDKCLREKNIDKNYFLLIAGARGWKDRAIYKTWQKARNRDRIKFLGYVNPEDKVYLYNLADLFVYLSFYEGFGFPPLEAAACGIPVIISAAGSLPEVMSGEAAVVNPFNRSEIARAMEEALNTPPDKDNLRQRAGIIKNKFKWENAAREYIKLFA